MMRKLDLFAGIALLSLAPAHAEAPNHLFHVVINVDLMPNDEAVGAALLRDYAGHARKDPDVRSVALIQQSPGQNHFIIDETFASESGYRRFVQSDAVRRWRTALYPHLGSPWDERTGHDVL